MGIECGFDHPPPPYINNEHSLKIISIVMWKSYLIIICAKSCGRLTKVELRSSWTQFNIEVHSNIKITCAASRESYLVMICPNSHDKVTKSVYIICV